MSETIDLFPGLNGSFKQLWIALELITRPIGDYLNFAHFIVAIIGVFSTLFHILVLTRKQMRALTINTFLLAIGICDLVRMIAMIIRGCMVMYDNYEILILMKCHPPPSYIPMAVHRYISYISKVPEQIAIWYAVTMAILRSLVMKFPLSKKINRLVHLKNVSLKFKIYLNGRAKVMLVTQCLLIHLSNLAIAGIVQLYFSNLLVTASADDELENERNSVIQ